MWEEQGVNSLDMDTVFECSQHHTCQQCNTHVESGSGELSGQQAVVNCVITHRPFFVKEITPEMNVSLQMYHNQY